MSRNVGPHQPISKDIFKHYTPAEGRGRGNRPLRTSSMLLPLFHTTAHPPIGFVQSTTIDKLAAVAAVVDTRESCSP